MGFLDREGSAEFPYHKADVFQAIMESIPTIDGMKVKNADRPNGRIFVKAGVSWWSWGENILISLTELSSGHTRVSITSTPKTGILFGGLFDYNKNKRNIKNILEATAHEILVQNMTM
jgi:hypothetical protein